MKKIPKDILRQAFHKCVASVWRQDAFPDDTELCFIREKLDEEFGKDVMKEMLKQADSGELWRD